MINFSVNQVRPLYVGTPVFKKVEKGGYFEVTQPDGKKVNTDLVVCPKDAMFVTIAESAKLIPQAKKYTIALADDALVPGQEYILTLVYRNYVGLSDAHMHFAKGYVKATTGMTEEQFYTKMADFLKLAIKKNANNLVKVEASATGITLTEQPVEWVRGLGDHNRVLGFDVVANSVIKNGDDIQWLKTKTTESGKEVVPFEMVAVENYPSGRIVADLEYFAYGETGSQHRWADPCVGYFPTEINYQIDPTKSYDVVTLHHKWEAAAQNKASEKDMVFAVEAGKGAALKTLIETSFGLNA